MSFQLLSPALRDALSERGISSPTPPQEEAIPKILKGLHALIVAPTGIGKTEAAVLPVLDSIYRRSRTPGIQCLYITPLRALNRDMLRRMEFYGKALGLRVGVRHGDTTQYERARQSENPPEVLITTPETLQILFVGKRLSGHIASVKHVIVDEIHELAGSERGAQLSVALERLSAVAGNYQRIGISATVGDPQEAAMFLGGRGRRVSIIKPETRRKFEIEVECPPPLADEPWLIDKLQGDPEIISVMKRAREIIEAGRSTLFFVNTRETAEWIAARYHAWDESFSAEVHHGSLSRESRTEMEDRFKRGEIKCLICTSSLELGIDVGSADTVIQYNSPRRVSRMIQRSGRAGHRVGETIRARILATAPDEISESLVIARRCAAGELESRSGRFSPLTVAANQLVAMAMTGPVEKDFAYSVFRGSYSFKTFTRETMDKIIEQLVSIRILFDNGDSFRRTRRGMDHFYENISMIPDVRNYKVIDVGTRAAVGTLDESFVSAFEDSRQLFIAKGRTWRVVEIREDEILVQETREMGAVPSWLGSDIPVPYEIAQEVGRLRAVRDYAPYPCTESCVAALETFFSGQDGHVMPTDRVITVEDDGTQVIVNACFGTKTNETLGRITAALMSMRLGESVGMTADPYRIILELPRIPEKNAVMDILKSLKPGSVDYLSRTAMAGSASLKWRFAYTAKKFGIIEKKADHRYINFGKLFEIHKGTPAYADAVDKVLEEDLDIIHAEEVVARICSGDIEIVPDRPSPVGREGITRSKELMQPMRADHAILMALKKRLGNEVLFSVCMNCGTSRRVRVEDAPKKFRCENCGGVMIALLKEYERDSSALILRKNHSSDDIKELKRMNKCANLVKENGSRAAYVMAGRGIGPETAARILRSMYIDEDGFFRAILEAEVLYAKNKQFWD